MSEKISKSDLLLLLGKEKSYVVNPIVFSCEFGTVDLKRLIGKKYGIEIKIGKENFSRAIFLMKRNLKNSLNQ